MVGHGKNIISGGLDTEAGILHTLRNIEFVLVNNAFVIIGGTGERTEKRAAREPAVRDI